MTTVQRTDRHAPVELAPAAALLLAIVFTIVPHGVGSDVLSAEPARTVTRPHAEVTP